MNLIEQGKLLGQHMATKFARDNRAVSPAGVAVTIVSVVVGLYMFALMFPDSLQALFGANWTGIPDGVETMGTTIVAIIGVVTFVLILLRQAD